MYTTRHAERRLRLLASLLFVALFAGCASGAVPPAGPNGSTHTQSLEAGRLITSSEIAVTGARTALEALERSHVAGLRVFSEGGAARLSLRGRRSFLYPAEPIVVLDGTLVHGTAILQSLPAGAIERIRVLQAPEAAHRYGTGAGGGAIVVEMRRGGR